MAIIGTGKDLGDKIAALIIAPDADMDAQAKIKKLWEGIGDTIVNHFVEKTELLVYAGITVSTTGTAAKQEGATTATGKGKIL